jgi:hypothetical protein
MVFSLPRGQLLTNPAPDGYPPIHPSTVLNRYFWGMSKFGSLVKVSAKKLHVTERGNIAGIRLRMQKRMDVKMLVLIRGNLKIRKKIITRNIPIISDNDFFMLFSPAGTHKFL